MKIVYVAVVLVLGFAAAAVAGVVTDRYYYDQHLVSPDGRLKLDAVSPDNAGDRPQPFADDFTYTLTDVTSGRIIWQRRQPGDEGSPKRVFFADAGHVVVYVSGEDLVVLDASTGRRSLKLSLLATFGEEERDAYVSWSTAGPMWWGTTHTYFVTHDEAVYFVLRTWWDRKLIVDLGEGRLLGGVSESLSGACLEAERLWAIAELDTAAANVETLDDAEWRVRRRAQTAIHLAGRLEITEAEGQLRVLELFNKSDWGTVVGWGEERVQVSGVDARSYSTIGIRQLAQLALRRIGKTPQELGCVWFKNSYGGSFYVPIAHEAPRHERVERVGSDMTPRQVLDTIGCPDFVVHYRNQWEYDVDGPDPCTLVLTFDEQWGGVEEVERVRPSKWKVGSEREARLNW